MPNPLAGVMPRSVYHKPTTWVRDGKTVHVPYAYGCTEAAIIRAAATGHNGIDLDLTIDGEGVGHANHWAQCMVRDAWRDPLGQLDHRTPIHQLTTEQATRLTSEWGPMLTATQAMLICGREKVIPCFEIKTDRLGRDRDPAWWAKFRVICDLLDSDPVIMSLPRGDKGIAALKVAHEAGFRTMWLWRGAYPARYDQYLTYVKSRPKHPIYQVSAPPVHVPTMPAQEEKAMRLITRKEWGARPRGATTTSHPIDGTLGVTLHWEGPQMGHFPHESCPRKVREIEAFHRDKRGWADIAYNFLVCPHGYVFEGRGIGVKSAANGFSKVNDDWYAVCWLGGQHDPFTAEGRVAFDQAVKYLRSKGAGLWVNGHRDHKSTECPGDVIYEWLNGHKFDTATPPREKPMNHVESYRAAIEQAEKDHGAKIPADREAAQKMRATINGALKTGPDA